ncbi:hypothetical protein C8R44DRAFT_946149 [Mycena epipterygia]|nr:hypothetical protein C8R44DRAFT_946149 [Mycena epipterygia]
MGAGGTALLVPGPEAVGRSGSGTVLLGGTAKGGCSGSEEQDSGTHIVRERERDYAAGLNSGGDCARRYSRSGPTLRQGVERVGCARHLLPPNTMQALSAFAPRRSRCARARGSDSTDLRACGSYSLSSASNGSSLTNPWIHPSARGPPCAHILSAASRSRAVRGCLWVQPAFGSRIYCSEWEWCGYKREERAAGAGGAEEGKRWCGRETRCWSGMHVGREWGWGSRTGAMVRGQGSGGGENGDTAEPEELSTQLGNGYYDGGVGGEHAAGCGGGVGVAGEVRARRVAEVDSEAGGERTAER